MHMAIMVVGKDPEDQMQKFDERTNVPRYIKNTKQQLVENERKSDKENWCLVDYETEEDLKKYIFEERNGSQEWFERLLKYRRESIDRLENFSDEDYYNHAVRWYTEYPEESESEDDDKLDEHGNETSTSNPDGKWDWYAIGGRYTGILMPKDGKMLHKGEPSWGWGDKDPYESGGYDQADKVSDVDWDKTIEKEHAVYGFLINGEWKDRDTAGEDGGYQKDAEIWKKMVWFTYKEIVDQYPNEPVTIIDIHT